MYAYFSTALMSPLFLVGTPQLTSSSQRFAAIIKSPVAGDIQNVHFGTKTVTTGATLSVRIETLTGLNPSGTLWATNTDGTQVVGNGDDDTWFSVALTAPATVSRGDIFAIVIGTSSGTPSLQMAAAGWFDATGRGIPYTRSYNGSIWGGSSTIPSIVPEFDTGFHFIPWVIPGTTAAVNVGPGGTIDEIGHRFKTANDLSIEGVCYSITQTTNLTYKLYTDAGTLLQSVSQPSVVAASPFPNFVPFNSPESLVANSWYRLTVVSGSNYEIPVRIICPSSDLMEVTPLGPNFQQVERHSSGSWTDYTLRQFMNFFPVFNGDGWVSGGIVPSSGTRMFGIGH